MKKLTKTFISTQVAFIFLLALANIAMVLLYVPCIISIICNVFFILLNIACQYRVFKKYEEETDLLKTKQEENYQRSLKTVYDEHIFSITHELRSPLAVVYASLNNQYNTLKGVYKSLPKNLQDEHKLQFKETKINIENIRHQSEIIEKFIASISEHASYINDSGDRKYIDLHKYLQSVIINSRSYSRNMKIFQNRVSFGDVTGVDFYNVKVQVSPHDLSRMLINIFTNAADAVNSVYKNKKLLSPEYQPTLKIRCIKSETIYKNIILCDDFMRINTDHMDGFPFYILIEDNGPGITQEHKDKIFKYGFTTKYEKDTKNIPSHHGLGLYLTIHLANKNNIGLFVRSDETGTSFAFGFPRIFLGNFNKIDESKDPDTDSVTNNTIISDDTKKLVEKYACSERGTGIQPAVKIEKSQHKKDNARTSLFYK